MKTRKDTRYHIHITSSDKKVPRGFKLTSIILENKKVIREHNMFTRTFVGTGDISKDIEFMKNNFSKMFNNITRFKIELLNQPNYIPEYNDINYREVHIKLKIQKDKFPLIKDILKNNEEKLNFRLSNNPKEVKNDYVTQFVNMRYFSGTSAEAGEKINTILNFLEKIDSKYASIIEKKEELAIYDTNFDEDKWWTE